MVQDRASKRHDEVPRCIGMYFRYVNEVSHPVSVTARVGSLVRVSRASPQFCFCARRAGSPPLPSPPSQDRPSALQTHPPLFPSLLFRRQPNRPRRLRDKLTPKALAGACLALGSMSLFKAREWWSHKCGTEEEFESSCLCVANIDLEADESGTCGAADAFGNLRIHSWVVVVGTF